MGILDDEGSASDADFFSQIRLDRTGLEAVREAAAAGSWPQASEELARYFLQRKAPRWYFDWRFRTEPVTAHWDRRHTWGTPQLVPLAERTNALLEDVFVDGNGGRHDVSDMERFIASKPRHGEKSQHVTMFIWATDLGVMYARTRDSRYARKLVELFRAYNRAFPRRVTNTNPENPWLDESHPPGWHEMFVGKAAMHMVATLYTGILHDPSVTLGDVYILIKKLWFYAAQFTRFTKVETYKHYNHHWYERGACPFMLGLMFPEFEGFEAMRERGREVINQHLELDFFDDGSYLEHSTCYNAGTMGADLLVPWTCAFANDFPLIKPENLGHVRSWLSWCAGLTRPDGVLPAIGDEFDSTPLNRLGRGAVLL
ncbi:MAG: heparinase II/III family protein, partial [Candidatus Latescibacteria bacterium]|nr:heparinase II/III family protein [Candidatus Latescibacterota bacterium]